MNWRILLALIVSISFTSIGFTQDQPEWQVTVFDGTEIIVITEDGMIDTLKIPDQLLERIMPGPSYKPFLLSDDLRYFVAVTTVDPDAFIGVTIAIADLEAGTCCIVLENPLGAGLLDITLGIFDPNNHLFTATIGTTYPDTTDDAMIVVDAETGDILQQVDPKPIMPGARIVEFLEWEGNEIELLPLIESAPGRGDFTDTHTLIWNLETDEFQMNERHFHGFFGVSLSTTGEYLRSNSSIDLSQSNGADTEGQVIELIVDGNEAGATPILSFTKGDYLPTPQWVLNGRAYLMRSSEQNSKLIFRDGTIVDVPFAEFTQFIAGTPDGWVAQQSRPPEDRTLFHFTLVDDEVQIKPIMTFDRILFTLNRPELGTNIERGTSWTPVTLD